MKHVTIRDIARELKFSIATVSRALNDDTNIRPETKQQILDTAKRLGYRKNPVAINLQSGRTRTIGVIVPEMMTPFAAKVIDGIQNVCYSRDYKVIITSSSEDPEIEKRNIGIMRQFMVDGVIACSCDNRFNTEAYQEIVDNGTPLVFYDRVSTSIEVPQVVVDDETKAFFLIEHLIRQGRKHIAYIGVDEKIVYNSYLRYRGYREALQRYGLEDACKDLVFKADGMRFSDGATVVDKMLDKGIDAIFAFTDTLAIGAMNRLISLNIKVPGEVAVAGYSGTELSTIVSPQLTTVEPHQYMMGQKAAELIFDTLNGLAPENRKYVIDAEIVYRKSTITNI